MLCSCLQTWVFKIKNKIKSQCSWVSVHYEHQQEVLHCVEHCDWSVRPTQHPVTIVAPCSYLGHVNTAWLNVELKVWNRASQSLCSEVFVWRAAYSKVLLSWLFFIRLIVYGEGTDINIHNSSLVAMGAQIWILNVSVPWDLKFKDTIQKLELLLTEVEFVISTNILGKIVVC